MRNRLWKSLFAAALFSLGALSSASAGVTKYVWIEEFGATW